MDCMFCGKMHKHRVPNVCVVKHQLINDLAVSLKRDPVEILEDAKAGVLDLDKMAEDYIKRLRISRAAYRREQRQKEGTW